ncbi:2-deoxyglucose-6-phosphate phosphatase [Trichoderma sp. SZMC 28011]
MEGHNNVHCQSFAGFLFDMDGTIVDTTKAITKHWNAIANELDVDASVIMRTSHGRRCIDVLKIIAPEKASWEYVKWMEGQIPLKYGLEATTIPGAEALLQAVTNRSGPWAIVTSSTEPLLSGWIEIFHLPRPRVVVTAECVTNGKPDPSCYRMGLRELDLEDVSEDVLVIEDSPAGIISGKAAGCWVLAVVTTHTIDQIITAGPDLVVKDLESIRLVGHKRERYEVEVSNVLYYSPRIQSLGLQC